MAKAARKRTRKLTLSITVDVVAIDSNYDAVTKGGFAYRQANVYPYLESKGYSINRKQGQMARRKYTAEACSNPATDYITGIGHGRYDTFTGDWGDVILKVGEYDAAEVKGKIVHLLSCQTASKLGRDMVSKGCSAYFGYDVDFTILDEYDDLFYECDSEVDRAFADGLSAGQVYDRVKSLFQKRIADLRATGKSGDGYAASVLETNFNHLMTPSVDPSFGSQTARLG
jgi:hypothetical protein